MQRQSVTARCAKSRQTPLRSSCPSNALRVASRVLVVEGDAFVHVVADRLHARPARRRVAEQRPGGLGEPVGLAIAAAEQIDDHLVRQLLDRHLLRLRRDRVGQAGVADQEIVRMRSRPAGAVMRVQMLPKPSS